MGRGREGGEGRGDGGGRREGGDGAKARLVPPPPSARAPVWAGGVVGGSNRFAFGAPVGHGGEPNNEAATATSELFLGHPP